MIFNSNKNFTYPVLYYIGNDYNDNSTFTLRVKAKRTKTKIILSISILLINKDIVNLINKDFCKIVIHVECSKTKFRDYYIYDFKKSSINITIPSNKLNGNVHINGFVISQKNISDYSSKDLSEFYNGYTFNIERGSILAFDDTRYIYIDKTNQEHLPVSSVVVVSSHDRKDEKAMFYDLNENKILIQLNKSDFLNYNQIKGIGEIKDLHHQIIVFPVIVEAIKQIILDDNDEFIHKRWYKSIIKVLNDEHNIDLNDNNNCKLDNAFIYAQKLLGYSLSRAMDNLYNNSDLFDRRNK